MCCLLKWRGFPTKTGINKRKLRPGNGLEDEICWNSGTGNLFISATYFRTFFLNAWGRSTQWNCHAQDIVSGAGTLLIGEKQMCEAPFLRLASAKCRQSNQLYSQLCLVILVLVARGVWNEDNWKPPMFSTDRRSKQTFFLNFCCPDQTKNIAMVLQEIPFCMTVSVIS